MKKTNSAIYIPNMDAKEFDKICAEKGLQFIYTTVQPHGRLIDADGLVDSFDPSDFWSPDAEGNCFAAIHVVNCAPTIIPAEEE